MIKAGVTDPAKVSRTALENGASIASLLLTTEARSLRFLSRRLRRQRALPAVTCTRNNLSWTGSAATDPVSQNIY